MSEPAGLDRGSVSRLSVLVALGTAAASFAVFAVLVSAGAADGVDAFSLRHLMPGFGPSEHGTSWLGSLLSYHGRQFHATLAIKLPAGLLPSSMLLALVCGALWRRGRRRSAVLWLAGFGFAVAVELICKITITRPALFVNPDGEPYHVTGFDSSFPSGHATRAVLLAAAIAFTWPVVRWLAIAWLASVVAVLELNGVHTPSDIVGGLLLALIAVLAICLADRRPGPAESARQVFAPRSEPR